MNNKRKWWLIARVILIILFISSVLLSPSKDNMQLYMRTIMIIILGVTFLKDLYDYRKNKE